MASSEKLLNEQFEYWSERTEGLMKAVQRNADILLDELLKAYQNAYMDFKASLEAKLTELGEDKAKWHSPITPEEKAKLKRLFQEAIDSDREGLMSQDAQLALSISRLDALIKEFDLQLTKLAVKLNNDTTQIKAETYQSIFNDIGLELDASSFKVINKEAVEIAVSKIWARDHFSTSIWNNKTKLTRYLSTAISSGILKGSSVQKMAKELDKVMKSGYKNAVRLIRTEVSYVMNQATQDAYMQCKVVEGQEWLTHPDERRCPTCASKHGQVFKYKDGNPQPALDTPPLHPNCRCTIIPTLISGSGAKELAERVKQIKENQSKETQTLTKTLTTNTTQLKYLEDKYGIRIKLNGIVETDISSRYLKDINNYVDHIYAKYPKLLQTPYKLRYIEFYNEDYQEQAAYAPRENSFSINLRRLMNLAKYGDPDDYDDIRDTHNIALRTFIHEMAHYYDYSITRETGKADLRELFSDGAYKFMPKDTSLFSAKVYKSVNEMLKADDEKLSKSYITSHLGHYAATDKAELFAEAYATGVAKNFIEAFNIRGDYQRRMYDHTNPISVKYVQLIENELNKLFK